MRRRGGYKLCTWNSEWLAHWHHCRGEERESKRIPVGWHTVSAPVLARGHEGVACC